MLVADKRRVLLVAPPRVAAAIAWFRDTMVDALRREAFRQPVLGDGAALRDYLHVAMSHFRHECVRVLYLNATGRLIREDELCEGSVSEAFVPVRTVMARALDLGASSLILVHNHPSGSPEPSQSDIDLTRSMIAAGRALEIEVVDHFIVAKAGLVSLKERGIL